MRVLNFAFQIHFIDTIEVVAALVVFETDALRILQPFEAGEIILVGDEFWGRGD